MSGIGQLVAVEIFGKGSKRSVVATKEECDNSLVGLSEVDVPTLVKGILESLND